MHRRVRSGFGGRWRRGEGRREEFGCRTDLVEGEEEEEEREEEREVKVGEEDVVMVAGEEEEDEGME